MMQLLATSPQIAFDRTYPFEVRYLTYLLQWSLLLDREWEPSTDWDSLRNFKSPATVVGAFPYRDSSFWTGQKFWKNCFRLAWHEFSQNAMTSNHNLPEMPLKYYAEKVPYWLPDYFNQLMPYNIILLIRDPRDVFLSITAFDKKRGFSGFNRLIDDDDWGFAKRLVETYQDRIKILHRQRMEGNSLLIKYEDLVTGLGQETERLGQWLGVTLKAEEVENQRASFAFHMTSESPLSSVGRWQRELSTELNDFFLRELGDELRYFGYEA